ncbi:hypothetical protein DFP73DRAFT_308303 [Morchella snyderi]|nr:hypothetical protein DFP73DRAFT_308303 [Morchella snyderi]
MSTSPPRPLPRRAAYFPRIPLKKPVSLRSLVVPKKPVALKKPSRKPSRGEPAKKRSSDGMALWHQAHTSPMELVADKVLRQDVDDGFAMRGVSCLARENSEDSLRRVIPLILSEGHSSKAMAKGWAKLDPKERRHGVLISVARYLLERKCPKICMRLIECCIHDTHVPNPEDISSVMEYLVALEFRVREGNKRNKRWLPPPRERIEKRASRYIELLMQMLQIDYGGALSIRQSTIYRLIQGASLEGVERLYDVVEKSRVILTTDTILHFIHRLSEPERWPRAYSILEKLTGDPKRNLNFPQVWKGFQTMFYKATFIGEEESSKVIRMMLQCGIGPGITSYNILMSKAVRDNDDNSLTGIFRQMFDSGLRPSMVTFGLLHNFYKNRNQEHERINVIRDAMQLDSKLNLVIATDILHAKLKATEYYFPVLEEYLNFFNPGPLIPLGMAPAEPGNLRRKAIQDKLEPNHKTIAVMVHAFTVHEQDPSAVWTAYKRYRSIIRNEQSEYCELIRKAGCYIPNSYMFALGQHESTLQYAVMIMEDMLKPNSVIHPNVHSWSILMHAMAKNRKVEHAEQVLGAMRRKGIQPNVVTWTSLLSGYVRIQSIRKAGDVLRRMDEHNVRPSGYTLRLLKNIVDSDELAKGMMLGGEPENLREQTFMDDDAPEIAEEGPREDEIVRKMTEDEIDRLLMRN